MTKYLITVLLALVASLTIGAASASAWNGPGTSSCNKYGLTAPQCPHPPVHRSGGMLGRVAVAAQRDGATRRVVQVDTRLDDLGVTAVPGIPRQRGTVRLVRAVAALADDVINHDN